MADFAVGEVIKLKSGGPNLTVSKIEGDRVHCVWFNQAGELVEKAISVAVLRKTGGAVADMSPNLGGT